MGAQAWAQVRFKAILKQTVSISFAIKSVVMPSIRSLLVVAVAAGVPLNNAIPTKMKAMEASGHPCSAPDWSCLSLKTIPVPQPAAGEILVQMKGSSVNPIDVDLVEPICRQFRGFGCANGTLGRDGAGVVIKVGSEQSDGKGSDCTPYKPGDSVWFVAFSAPGTYAEYAVIKCSDVGMSPKSWTFQDAGTIGTAGQTALQCLQAAGTLKGKTVVVTSGQGGTGVMGIQIAKALGASSVITAATGTNIDVMKKLGADKVIDYHKQKVFDALPADSVDVVFDNFGLKGTADEAMPAIRSGGVFALLPGGNGGQASKNPKQGVRQVPNCRARAFATDQLDILKGFADAGVLKAVTMPEHYGIADVPKAFTRSKGHGVLGKIVVDVSVVSGGEVVV